MRRMYSEQELTKIIHDVVGDYIEDGAFDESISDAVDAYLVDHPVDITALAGKDVELNSLDANGLITGGEIVEKMSGYEFTKDTNLTANGFNLTYASVVKTGNKITFAIAGEFTPNENTVSNPSLGAFTFPTSIGSKLYADSLGALDNINVNFFNSATAYIAKNIRTTKTAGGNAGISIQCFSMNTSFTQGTLYSFRYEETFLLSDTLLS